MISTTENTLRYSEFALVDGVLYLASDTKTFWLPDDWGHARPAAQQPDVFKLLLEAEIPAIPVPWLAAFLQSTLDALIAAEAPPAPRYPQVGDHCSGLVVWVQQTLRFTGARPLETIWVGYVQADIAANGYSTPPADGQNYFRFQFISTTPIAGGAAISFDIAQGKYSPYATIS